MRQRIWRFTKLLIAVILALFATNIASVATVYADTPDSPLPADGVQSLAYTDGSWTLTLKELGASEVKLIDPAPQEIVCGTNYDTPCATTSYTFQSQAECITVQIDWSDNLYNSSDPRVCRPLAVTNDTETTNNTEYCQADQQQLLADDCVDRTIPPPTCVSTIGRYDISAHYTIDDYHAFVQYKGRGPLCEGVSKTVSLNSYATEGPTWSTSGTQTFVDHDQVTISASNLSGSLSVEAPGCFYQTDLYWGSTKYDGNDGALPHYPETPTPPNLIAARNGGRACPKVVTPPDVVPTYPTCANPTTAGFTITKTKGVIYKVTINGTTTYAHDGFNAVPVGASVTVTAKAKFGYVLNADAQKEWSFTFAAATNCDICANIPDVQTTVPDGYVLATDGNCYQPGGRGGDDTPVPPVLTPPSVTTTSAPELANTGANDTVLIMLVGLAIIGLAIGATFSTRQPSAEPTASEVLAERLRALATSLRGVFQLDNFNPAVLPTEGYAMVFQEPPIMRGLATDRLKRPRHIRQ